MEQVSESRCFGGWQRQFRHPSEVNRCEMVFSVFLPPQSAHGPVPLLYWLSGLTCTDENFVTKAGAQRYAAEHGLAIVVLDTSPRGDGVPDEVEDRLGTDPLDRDTDRDGLDDNYELFGVDFDRLDNLPDVDFDGKRVEVREREGERGDRRLARG